MLRIISMLMRHAKNVFGKRCVIDLHEVPVGCFGYESSDSEIACIQLLCLKEAESLIILNIFMLCQI